MKLSVVRSFAGLLLAAAAFAQPPADKPKLQFEVASIKLAGPIDPAAIAAGKRKIGMSVDGPRVELNMLAVSDLIQMAYKLKPGQLTLLDWMKDPMIVARYDIVAKMPEGATKDDVPVMLQGLLADRFGLVMRKETKEGVVTSLVVGKGGPKLKESVKEDPSASPKDEKGMINMGGASMRQSGNTVEMRVKNQPGKMKMTMQDGKMHYSMTEVPMDRFAEMLSQFTGGPVVNQTGLKGAYDVEFEMSMADMLVIAQKAGVNVPPDAARALTGGGNPNNPAEAASDPASAGGIQRSLQQLGLALEKGKGPVDHYTIEKVEKSPTEN